MKLTIDLERATEATEETWVSHCLEIDCISQGPTPQDAIVMIAEAVDMMVNDEIEAQERAGNPSPGWERAFANIAEEIPPESRIRTVLSSGGGSKPRKDGYAGTTDRRLRARSRPCPSHARSPPRARRGRRWAGVQPGPRAEDTG